MLYQQGLAASFSSFGEAGQRLETGVSNNILDEQIPQLPLRWESRFSTYRWGGRSRKLCGKPACWFINFGTDWETCVKQVAGAPSHKGGRTVRPPVQEKHDLYPCWVGHLSASSIRWCTTWPFWFASCFDFMKAYRKKSRVVRPGMISHAWVCFQQFFKSFNGFI